MKTSNRAETRAHRQYSRRGMTAAMALAVGLIAGLLAPPAGAENFATEIADAFKAGKFNVDFRYRYEFVDRDTPRPGLMPDPVTKNANASTLRTRLVFTSGEYKNFFVTLNMDDVHTVVASDYNSTRNGKTRYAAVADPTGTDLNLASLTFTGLKDGTIVLGRQRIIRENARFIGNVVWRQNEQTYDAASINYNFTDKFQAFYSYVDAVKRVFGPDAGTPAATLSSDSHLIDASYAFAPLVRVFAYAYLLEFKNSAAFSSQTLGLKLTGKQAFGDNLTFSYLGEYAKQEDYKNNTAKYDEGYYHVNAGLDWPKIGIKLGYEVLEGDGLNGSFQTPLATLYAHNGWADQFLVTPIGGLKDAYIAGTAKFLGGKWNLVYHDFSAQTGSSDYGTEIDFTASWPFLERYSVLAGFAAFDSDSNNPIAVQSDITKVWLMLTAAF